MNLTSTSSIGLHRIPISVVEGSPGLFETDDEPTIPPDVNSELLAEIVISSSCAPVTPLRSGKFISIKNSSLPVLPRVASEKFVEDRPPATNGSGLS